MYSVANFFRDELHKRPVNVELLVCSWIGRQWWPGEGLKIFGSWIRHLVQWKKGIENTQRSCLFKPFFSSGIYDEKE